MINEKEFLYNYFSNIFLHLINNGYYLRFKKAINSYVNDSMEVSQKEERALHNYKNIEQFNNFYNKYRHFKISYFSFRNKDHQDIISPINLNFYLGLNKEEKLFFIQSFDKFFYDNGQYKEFLKSLDFNEFKDNMNNVKIRDFRYFDYQLDELIEDLKKYDITEKEYFTLIKNYVRRRKVDLNKYHKAENTQLINENFNSEEIKELSKYLLFLGKKDDIKFFEKSFSYISEIKINLRDVLKNISSSSYNLDDFKNDFLDIFEKIKSKYEYSHYTHEISKTSESQILIYSDNPILINEIKDDISTIILYKIENPEHPIDAKSILPILESTKLKKELAINPAVKKENFKI